MKLGQDLIFYSLLLFGHMIHTSYLWELQQGYEKSCCLSFQGLDICNPYVPCTRHIHTDLHGILEYIVRLVSTEKGPQFSHYNLLLQAQNFIKYVLVNPIPLLNYRFDDHRSVKFMHDVQETQAKTDKITKSSTASSSSASNSSNSDKAKLEDAVMKYLVKIGAARPLK